MPSPSAKAPSAAAFASAKATTFSEIMRSASAAALVPPDARSASRATMTPCASQANRTVSIQLVQKPIISFMVYGSRYPETGTAPQRDQENITQTSQNLLKSLTQ